MWKDALENAEIYCKHTLCDDLGELDEVDSASSISQDWY